MKKTGFSVFRSMICVPRTTNRNGFGVLAAIVDVLTLAGASSRARAVIGMNSAMAKQTKVVNGIKRFRRKREMGDGSYPV